MRALFREKALFHLRFAELHRKWSDDDVEYYLSVLCSSPTLRREALESLHANNGLAVILGYHERVEMDEMEKLVNETIGTQCKTSDYFSQHLRARSLSREQLHFMTQDGAFSYLVAHYQASREEVMFAVAFARYLGYRVQPQAVIATKPNFLEDHPEADSLQEIYGKSVQRQLGIRNGEDVLNQFPSKDEIKDAKQFWEVLGVSYSAEANRRLAEYVK